MPAVGVDAVLAWALTYLVHSSLFLAGAWLLERALAKSHPRTKDVIWKTALVGGILTAGLQHGAALEPQGGHWSLQPIAAVEPGAAVEPAAAPAPELARFTAHPVASSARGARDFSGPAELAAAPVLVTFTVDPVAPEPLPATAIDWRQLAPFAPLALGAWALFAALGLLRWFRRSRSLHRLLKRARPIEVGPAASLLIDLRHRSGHATPVRLLASKELSSPISTGIRSAAIVLPERALWELSRDDLEGVLAHELAHVVRRDSLWLAISSLVERLFFFQPFNRLARRRMHTWAEFLCDDWAVGLTRRSLSLARCLTQVAGWVLEGPPPVHAPAMAATAQLSSRVERLLDDGHLGTSALPGWALKPLGFGATLLVAIAVPGVRAASAPLELAPPDLSAADATPVATAPAAPAAPGGVDTTPASAPVADSALLLSALDLELDALDGELVSLRSLVAELGDPSDLVPQLLRIEERRATLDRKRTLLAALLDRLQEPRAASRRALPAGLARVPALR